MQPCTASRLDEFDVVRKHLHIRSFLGLFENAAVLVKMSFLRVRVWQHTNLSHNSAQTPHRTRTPSELRGKRPLHGRGSEKLM
mmetsp:Transcript_29539/g.80816  ORF Transcript_29539/g.80816 Transcript_29539/m.80816 type:complete len:83 (+) Transcript_29539:70-318(+)